MKKTISRESDKLIKPNISFITDSIKSLKEEGKCYAFKKEQIEFIKNEAKINNMKLRILKKEWYWLILLEERI